MASAVHAAPVSVRLSPEERRLERRADRAGFRLAGFQRRRVRETAAEPVAAASPWSSARMGKALAAIGADRPT